MSKIAPVSNYTEISISALKPILALAYKRKTNLFLLGDPGLGKTENIAEFASSVVGGGAKLVTLVASMLDRLDLAGLPYRTAENKTEFALMSCIADATKELNPDGGPTIIYLNEVNGAPDSVQPALLRLLNERAVSGYTLRDNVMLIADGNHAVSSRIAREMPEPSKRRFLWIHIRIDKDDWMKYSRERGCDARVMAFIQAYAQEAVLCDFQNGERGRTTYACPASWTRLGADLPEILADLPDQDSRQAWIDGQVGAGIGKQFAAFIEHQHNLPDTAEFLKLVGVAGTKDAAKVVLPSDLDARWMLLGMVANLVRERKDSKDVASAIILTIILLSRKMGEEAIFFFRTVMGTEAVKQLILKSKELPLLTKEFRNNPELLRAITDSSLVDSEKKKKK